MNFFLIIFTFESLYRLTEFEGEKKKNKTKMIFAEISSLVRVVDVLNTLERGEWDDTFTDDIKFNQIFFSRNIEKMNNIEKCIVR